jgi:Ca2+-binding RTX toxin-like protein
MVYIRGKWTSGGLAAAGDGALHELEDTDITFKPAKPPPPVEPAGDGALHGPDDTYTTFGPAEPLPPVEPAGPPKDFIQKIQGTDGDDEIVGWDGIDIIDGGGGEDTIYGGGGNDVISGNNGYPHDGSNPAETDWLEGEGGDDKLYGDNGDDFLFGGDDSDELFGNEGSDWLDGGDGLDVLCGGDWGDWLTGGSGYDTFKYNFPGSESSVADPDQIMDFTDNNDTIDFPEFEEDFYGTYEEDTISYNGGYTAAKDHAASFLDGSTTYAFVTDKVNGYLFADFNENGEIDSAIILVGLTELSDFAFGNIH